MRTATLLVIVGLFAIAALTILGLASCAPVTCLYSHDQNRCGF